ncbi:hypothetical protein [Demequina sp.]|uniref:hypothetical protein n=1 Tax=Demequina sp. TaxID=2050685 RepID=UPI0025FD1919|nr:hypothetical protein [Demequina sp.]
MTPRPHAVLGAAVAGVVLAVSATGCSWRAETPPIERRTPSPEVVIRDQAAEREQSVIDAEPTGMLGEIQTLTAPERLAALGGVYVATPGASPSPSMPPALDEAVRAAMVGALADAAAAQPSDPALAALLRSIGLSHAVALGAADAAGAGPAARIVPEETGLGTSLTPESGTAVAPATLARLAVAHDRAAFVYQVAAARAEGDERLAALERSALHRERADAFATLPGVEDARQELYDVPPASVADAGARASTERGVETSLGWNYAALLDGVATPDSRWILNAAYDAYLQAASLPGFLASDVPALPGIAVDGA